MTQKTRTPRPPSKRNLRKRMDEALAQLELIELVKALPDKERAFSIKHALVQDTAQSTLLHGEYKRLNRLVADAYETVYGTRALDEFAAVLAQHFAAAGDDAKTITYATRAGELAAKVYANAEAIAFYTQALTLARHTPYDRARLIQLYSHRGRAWELMTQYDLALANYADMESLAQARRDPVMELEALMARATIYSTPNARFNSGEAYALSKRSLALARELGDRAYEAKILWNLLLVAHFSGHIADALEYGAQSIALARELDLREQLAYSLNDFSRPCMLSNQLERGIAALSEARELWRALGNLPMLADNLNTHAMLLFNLGDYEDALAKGSEAYQIGQSVGNLWTQAHSLMIRGAIQADRGEVAGSIATMREGMEVAEQAEFVLAAASTKNNLALTYASMGDVTRGLNVLATPYPPRKDKDAWNSSLHAVRAQLYLMQGDIERARTEMQESERAFEYAAPTPFLMGSHRLAAAELALAEQDFARTIEQCDALLGNLGERGMRSVRLYAVYLRARALFRLGRNEEAYKDLEKARTEAERVGMKRYLWRMLALLGEIETARGHPDQADRFAAHARAELARIAAQTPDEYQNTFLNLPEARALLERASDRAAPEES